jgi:hypothetical protein
MNLHEDGECVYYEGMGLIIGKQNGLEEGSAAGDIRKEMKCMIPPGTDGVLREGHTILHIGSNIILGKGYHFL